MFQDIAAYLSWAAAEASRLYSCWALQTFVFGAALPAAGFERSAIKHCADNWRGGTFFRSVEVFIGSCTWAGHRQVLRFGVQIYEYL